MAVVIIPLVIVFGLATLALAIVASKENKPRG